MAGRTHNPQARFGFALALVVAAALLLADAVVAQPIVANHPAGTMSVVSPQYLLRVRGTTGCAPRYREYHWQPSGTWSIRTGTGDPLRADNGRTIAGGAGIIPDAGFDPVYNCYGLWAVDALEFEVSDADLQYDWECDPADLPIFWIIPPTQTSRGWWGMYVVPVDIAIGTDLPQDSLDFLTVRQVVEIYNHQVKIEYIVTNTSINPHDVGLRVVMDTTFDAGSPRDGKPVLLSTGDVVETETAISSMLEDLPAHWLAFEDPSSTNPAVILRAILKGGEVNDPGFADSSAKSPDRVEIGTWTTIGIRRFIWPPTRGLPIDGEDWGCAARWDQTLLQPGTSRRYVTYFGLGGWEHHLTPTYCLAAWAPFNLKPNEDDPTTFTVEPTFLSDGFGNDPFPLVATVDNFGASTLQNVALTVSLPQGLEFDPVGQSRTQNVGRVLRNQVPLPTAQWTVSAATARAGQIEVRFTGPQGKSLRRMTGVPALPVLTQDLVNPITGLEMISFPYAFSNTDAEDILRNLIGPTGSLNSPNYQLVRWEPRLQEYRFFPDPFITNVIPGDGFWLVNRTRKDIELRGLDEGRSVLSLADAYDYEIKAGWNQIGSPFISRIVARDMEFIGPDNVARSFEGAMQASLLLPTLYWYDSLSDQYLWDTDFRAQALDPYVGYWMLGYENLLVRFTPPRIVAYDADAGAPPAVAGATSPLDWRLDLEVCVPGARRCSRTIGAQAAAQDGPDPQDVPSPPASMPNGPKLEAYFPHEEWGGLRAGAYLVDMRGLAGGPKAWDLVVATDVPHSDIEIAWPKLNETIPKHVSLRLEDVDAGCAYNMRTTAVARLRTGEDGATRRLRIVARRQQPGAAQLVGALAAVPIGRGGAEIVYALAQDSSVGIRITNIAGRVVKDLLAGAEQASGEHRIAWNGLANSGVAVPRGRYIVRVTAASADGLSTSRVTALNLQR